MGKIELEGIEFYANHGCFHEEQKCGGHYLVDIKAELNLDHAAETDDIQSSFDYQELYRIAEEEMAIPAAMIEHVCKRIIDRIVAELVEIDAVKVKVSKLNPPMKGRMKSVSVTMKRERKL